MPPDLAETHCRNRLIVMVDDDAEDQFLAAEALHTLGGPVELLPLASGRELFEYLNREGRFADLPVAPRPDLILLDLNMPQMDGHETLQKLRDCADFKDVPVIIFSTSRAPADVTKAYRGGANTYVAKPQSFDALCETLATVSEYWFTTAETPNAE